MKENILKEKSFGFAIRIIKLFKYLSEEKKEFIISKQIMRSGCSVGANVREANNTSSKKDFVHKLSIAQKECDETLYWLELLYSSEIINKKEFESLSMEAIEILKIIKSSIIRTRTKLNNKNNDKDGNF